MNLTLTVFVIALVVSLASCSPVPANGRGTDTDAAAAGSLTTESDTKELADAHPPADGHMPPVVVYKSPTCGCCESWVGHMQKAGFSVEVRDMQDIGPIKAEAGVPAGLGSCHTARIGDYFVEGHVPPDDVKRLLAEHPDARGLAVAGMPQGSPGMEQGRASEPYDVLLVAKDGSTSVFARHGE